MRRRLCLLSVVLSVFFGWENAAGQLQSPVTWSLASKGTTTIPFSFGKGTWAVWGGASLLAVQDRFSSAPQFRIFDREGKEISQFTLVIPGADHINVYEFARGGDGSFAVAGSAYTNDARSTSFLAWVSSDCKDQTIVRLSPFVVSALTISPDGMIWVAGHNKREFAGEKQDYSQHLIRRYDRTGRLLGSFIPWSMLGDAPRALPPDIRSILTSSPDRIGWYVRESRTYIEFSSDGEVKTWVGTPESPNGVMLDLALCEDGSLFVSAAVLAKPPHQTASWGIYALERAEGKWSFVSRPERWGKVYGCEAGLLASTTSAGIITWLEPTKK